MTGTATTQITTLPAWVTAERIAVTAVTGEMALITRTQGPGAITVEAAEDGNLYVSGQVADLDPDTMAELCAIVDVVMAGFPRLGDTYHADARYPA